MAIQRATCPECGAGLKTNNPQGFAAGETLECPKCKTYFAVEADAPPAAMAKPAKAVVAAVVDDDEDRPRRSRRDYDDDEDDRDDDRPRRNKKKAAGGYKTSPIRFVVLGVLVAVMCVLGYLLFLKMKADQEARDHNAKMQGQSGDPDVAPPINFKIKEGQNVELKPLAPPGAPGR